MVRVDAEETDGDGAMVQVVVESGEDEVGVVELAALGEPVNLGVGEPVLPHDFRGGGGAFDFAGEDFHLEDDGGVVVGGATVTTADMEEVDGVDVFADFFADDTLGAVDDVLSALDAVDGEVPPLVVGRGALLDKKKAFGLAVDALDKEAADAFFGVDTLFFALSGFFALGSGGEDLF